MEHAVGLRVRLTGMQALQDKNNTAVVQPKVSCKESLPSANKGISTETCQTPAIHRKHKEWTKNQGEGNQYTGLNTQTTEIKIMKKATT